MNLFTNNRLLYEGRDSWLSEEKIRQSLGVGGNKINSFIQFYLMFDGVLFPKQAMMFRHAFYSIEKGDWDIIEIGLFCPSPYPLC